MSKSAKFQFDEVSVERTKYRLRAWWQGQAFDEHTFAADLARRKAEVAMAEAAAHPIDPSPRCHALELVWGEGRIGPWDREHDENDFAFVPGNPDVPVLLIGADLGGPVLALANACPNPITVYEWRPGCTEVARYRVAMAGFGPRITIQEFDLEAGQVPENTFGAIISRDMLLFANEKRRLMRRMHQALKSDGIWAAREFVVPADARPDGAFVSAWADPQYWDEPEYKAAAEERGMTFDSEPQDIAALQVALKRGFERIADAVEVIKQRSETDGLRALIALREMGWEAEAVKARLHALGSGHLVPKRMIFRPQREVFA